MDFLMDGQANGPVANVLMKYRGDTGALRPFIGKDGQSYITLNAGTDEKGVPQYRTLVSNAPATLPKEAWLTLDRVVQKAARPRLNVVADLRAAGLVYTIPNGMAFTSLQYQAMSDPGVATVSMSGRRQGEGFRPEFDLRNLPLPITHADFSFDTRELMASRQFGLPLDTSNAEAAARRVAEETEKFTLGVRNTFTYGGGTVYGIANALNRLTKVLTAPTTGNQATTVAEVIAMVKQATDNNFFGPFVLYYSPAWYPYMSGDYTVTTAQPITLKQRLQSIENISAVKPADYLTGTTLLLVQQTSDVIRMVVGMEITTVQWQSPDGMESHFKVMCIIVPQVRWDAASQSGIVHGAV